MNKLASFTESPVVKLNLGDRKESSGSRNGPEYGIDGKKDEGGRWDSEEVATVDG